MDYYQKYKKYKGKYMDKRNFHGGSNTKAAKAVAFVRPCNPTDNISGVIRFEKLNDGVKIVGQVSGLAKGKHGFHVHESADITKCCDSLKGHYNPFGKTHGGPNSEIRHVGDLGNIEADDNGVATIDFIDNMIKLDGPYSIVGRSIVVHADEDDLGLGGFPDSLTTGHAGKRVGYAVIGIDS
jgi:Cu-Zn family superoxide dismutase